MPILGTLLKKGIRIREMLEQDYSSPEELQKKELKELLIAARNTAFGKHYRFSKVLKSFRQHDSSYYDSFSTQIPIFDYDTMYEKWWNRSLAGNKDICWPGRIKYFALSSGTSGSSSKSIPVTMEMTKAIQKTSIRQILTLSKYELESEFYQAGILMLGGSTHLNKRGRYFEGDLSGIQAARLPFWFQHFYKPGRKIAKTRDWEEKLDEICRKAPEWNIGIIVGVPAWIQILIEKILAYHQVSSIHTIWPNLRVYVHGGVSFDPYRKGFENLLSKPIYYIETYLASEGFIAFQNKPSVRSMRLVLNNGIFYEFILFNEQNFETSGELKPDAKAISIHDVEEEKEYALLLSTCAGAWRYLIGDVIKFTNLEESEIIITGRTKHFLSLCGEHLSVDNMTKALSLVADELNISIKEFTVAGIPSGSLFAHHWYVGTDDRVDKNLLKEKLDAYLKELNDDYLVERSAALKEIMVDVLPVEIFYRWMESKGKVGGQNKFPRVMKNDQYADWKNFVNQS